MNGKIELLEETVDNEFDYEVSFNRLEKIVNMLETGNGSVDQSLELFNEAVKLYTNCRKALDNAKLQVDMLVSEDE